MLVTGLEAYKHPYLLMGIQFVFQAMNLIPEELNLGSRYGRDIFICALVCFSEIYCC
jgi:hypothetical protein